MIWWSLHFEDWSWKSEVWKQLQVEDSILKMKLLKKTGFVFNCFYLGVGVVKSLKSGKVHFGSAFNAQASRLGVWFWFDTLEAMGSHQPSISSARRQTSFNNLKSSIEKKNWITRSAYDLNLRNSSVPYRYYKQSYHFWGLCTLIRSNYSKFHQLLSVHFFKIENRKILEILSFFTVRRTHKNKMQQALKSKNWPNWFWYFIIYILYSNKFREAHKMSIEFFNLQAIFFLSKLHWKTDQISKM